MLSVAVVASCDSSMCPECPATYLGLGLVVRGSGSAGVLAGVSVTFSGPQTGAMSCEPNQGAVLCTWPGPVPVTPGTYSLAVMASDVTPMTISATVTIDPDPQCGCTSATLTPSDVTLDPM